MPLLTTCLPLTLTFLCMVVCWLRCSSLFFVNNPTGELLLLYQKKGKNWNYFLEFVLCPYIRPKRAPLDHPFMEVSKGDVNQCLAKPDLGRLWAGLLPRQLRLWVRLCATVCFCSNGQLTPAVRLLLSLSLEPAELPFLGSSGLCYRVL